MFKITKWHALIGAIILLFSSVIVEAGAGRKRKALQAQQEENATQKRSRMMNPSQQSTSGKDAEGMTVQEKRKAVRMLDQQAQEWNYKGFNWVELHPYFSQYIGFTEFLYATKDEGYPSITALAQKLLGNTRRNTRQTVAEVKFFVYSALNALYRSCTARTDSGYQVDKLLQQVYAAMKPYTPDSITYARDELMQGEIENVLARYENNFVLNSSIVKVILGNPLSNFIKAINKSAGVYQPCALVSIPQTQVHGRSTVEEIMQYYPNEKERIFVFLMRSFAGNKVTETMGGYNSMLMKREPQLRKYLFEAFTGLWKSNLTDIELEDLARIAILGFGLNPLTGMLSDMPEPVVPGATNVPQPVEAQGGGTTAISAQKANRVLKFSYVALVSFLPINKLLTSFQENGVITPEFRQTLHLLPKASDRTRKLLDKISGELAADCTKNFESFLEAMEENDNPLARHFAQQIRNELAQQ